MQHRLPLLVSATLMSIGLAQVPALALENAKVLPQGVRRFTLRTAYTRITEKSTADGGSNGLAAPLEKTVTFRDVLKDKSGLDRSLSEGFLLANGDKYPLDTSVGEIHADLKAELQVFAPIFAYGVTRRITLAVAVPIYRGRTVVKADFQPSDKAQSFVGELANSYNNQMPKAQETADKLNNVIRTFQEKLADNGYKPLADWHATGLGDTKFITRGLITENKWTRVAAVGEITAPTGRTDDPNILTDVKFGDGQWDVGLGGAVDEQLLPFLSLNQYAKYTVQLPGHRKLRRVTPSETIQVENADTRFRLGDIIEAGTSVQAETESGMVGGIGYVFMHKGKDKYSAGASSAELEKNTWEESHQLQGEFGYSTVPAFKRGEVPVPAEARFAYTHFLKSQNKPIANLFQLDVGVFF